MKLFVWSPIKDGSLSGGSLVILAESESAARSILAEKAAIAEGGSKEYVDACTRLIPRNSMGYRSPSAEFWASEDGRKLWKMCTEVDLLRKDGGLFYRVVSMDPVCYDLDKPGIILNVDGGYE